MAWLSGGCARTTRSVPEGIDDIIAARRARRTRLALLRVTALPTARGTTKPIRAGMSVRPHGRAVWTTTRRFPERRPRIATAKSCRSRKRCRAGNMRTVRRTTRRDPYVDERPKWPGPLAWTCDDGSRACGRGAGCWAGRCACSRQSPFVCRRGARSGRVIPRGRPRHRHQCQPTVARHDIRGSTVRERPGRVKPRAGVTPCICAGERPCPGDQLGPCLADDSHVLGTRSATRPAVARPQPPC